MFSSMLAVVLSTAVVSAGLMAGVYFAFSGFIMRAFDQLDTDNAAEAMNAINRVILRSWFMLLFFGSTALFATLVAVAVYNPDLPGRWLLLSAGLIYVLGMFACTVVFNVPLNSRLAETTQHTSARSEIWRHYFRQWTRWNHVRSACSLMAVVLLMNYVVQYS